MITVYSEVANRQKFAFRLPEKSNASNFVNQKKPGMGSRPAF